MLGLVHSEEAVIKITECIQSLRNVLQAVSEAAKGSGHEEATTKNTLERIGDLAMEGEDILSRKKYGLTAGNLKFSTCLWFQSRDREDG